MSKKKKSLLTMNEDLPKVLNVTIPFELKVQINENGSKSFPVFMRHADCTATAIAEGEGDDRKFTVGGTMGAGYALEFDGLDDCKYGINANTILKAFIESLEKAGFNLDK